MALPDPSIVYAVVVAAVYLAGFYIRWDDLEIGEVVYALLAAIVIAASVLIVPYNIPTTGKIVFAPAWNPPKYDVIDPITSKIITPEIVEQMRKESPIPLSEDFYHNSVTISKNALRSYEGFWWAAIDIVCFAGWFVIPQWLEGIVNPPRRRRHRPRDERESE